MSRLRLADPAKQLKYDMLCNTIRHLTEKMEYLIKNNMDITEYTDALEKALTECLEFIQKEFHSK